MIQKTSFSLLAGMFAGAVCAAQPFFQEDFEADFSSRWQGVGAYWKTTKTAFSSAQAVQRVLYPGTRQGNVAFPAKSLCPVPQGKVGFSIYAAGANSDDSFVTPMLRLELYDAAGKRMDQILEYRLNSTVNQYQQTTGEISFPAGAAQFRPVLNIKIHKDLTKITYIRFDQLKIMPLEESAPAAAQKSASTSKLALHESFEGDLSARWKGIGAYWRQSSGATDGKQSMQRVLYVGTQPGLTSTDAISLYPVPSGKVGFSIDSIGGDALGTELVPGLVLKLYDAAGKSLAPLEYSLKSDVTSYQNTTQEIVFPANAVKFRPALKVTIKEKLTEIKYVRFDNLKIGQLDLLGSVRKVKADNGTLDLDFEADGAGWAPDNKIWRISNKAKTGTCSLECLSPSCGAKNGSEQFLQSERLLPVQAGETYRLCGYVTSTEQTLSTRMALEVAFLDADGKVLGNDGTRPLIPAPTRWMEVSALVKAPANAVSARLGLRVIATKEIKRPFSNTFDAIRMPLWSVEKQLATPKGTPPTPIELEDPDSGKVTSGCLSIGKFYQSDRAPQAQYPDIYPNAWTLGSKLTDGQSQQGASFKKPGYVAWKGVDPVAITVDLGRAQTLESVAISGFKDEEAHFGEPESFTVSVSTDKKKWQDWGVWKGAKDRPLGAYHFSIRSDAQKARYIRLTIQPDQAKKHGFLMLDEITLNGKIKNTWKYVPANGSYHAAFPPTYGIKEPLRAGRKKPLALPIYETIVGKKVSMILWYQGLSPERPFSELQELRLHDMTENHYGQRFMSFGWLPGANVTLQDIITGKLDEYFTEYFSDSIDEAKTYGDNTPIWFRPMNEFNSGWVSWGLDPDSFLLAWRRMYNIAEQIGAAEHHIFVWSPNHRSYPDVEWNKMEKYYPGDQYVDWVGLSCYPPSRQYVETEGDRYPYGRVKEINEKYGDRKPMMIAEGGYDSPDKMDRVRWVKEWFGFREKFPNFKAMIWENHGTRVIQDGGEALEVYRKEVQDPYWISETYLGK